MGKKLRFATLAVTAATALAIVAGSGAWRAHATRGAASAREGSSASQKVTVHGRWSLTVKSRDGRIVVRRRFENSLLPDGKNDLMQILAQHASQGVWGIRLSSTLTAPCNTPGPYDPNSCLIREDGVSTGAWQSFYPDVPKTLKVTIPVFGALHFSGTVVATRNGTVDHVETKDCFALGTTGDNCNNLGSFSGTDVASTPVAAGQQVLVTVDLSFS